MNIFTVRCQDKEQAAVRLPQGLVLVETMNRECSKNWPTDVMALLESDQLQGLSAWLADLEAEVTSKLPALAKEDFAYAPLTRRPRKIWGVGFNYVEDDAALLQVDRSEEPVGFMKPDTALIGYGDAVVLPPQSERVIAEAELAIVIGRECRDVTEAEAEGCIAGYAAIFDMGADDIHRRNPRYLTRSKSFDTFFSLGPELVTPDEVADIEKLQVTTVHNGEVIASKRAGLMRFQPVWIVAFHSQVMTLLPGDIIMTGTPGAAVVRDGDVIECRIEGFEPLVNRVKAARR
ncbi:fumarylacetoacetate hydrolase family protein [Paenibacillus daejeonensis]|uniref:fumarylacetoacetate hydrolase family protein n=1 Tax=Paenibacillus daejeonensis TaxID=135193 RepID=UPI00036AC3A6|nr:fumarylacetoacetate hydrolase family protein [Paenibacillus daejeonensis]